MKIKLHTLINGSIALLFVVFIVFGLVSGLAYNISLNSLDTTDYTLSIYDRKVFGSRSALNTNYEKYVDEAVTTLNENGEKYIVVKIKGEDAKFVNDKYVLVYDSKMADSKVVEIYKAQQIIVLGSAMPAKTANLVINLVLFGTSGLVVLALGITELILYLKNKDKELLKWVLSEGSASEDATATDSDATEKSAGDEE